MDGGQGVKRRRGFWNLNLLAGRMVVFQIKLTLVGHWYTLVTFSANAEVRSNIFWAFILVNVAYNLFTLMYVVLIILYISVGLFFVAIIVV